MAWLAIVGMALSAAGTMGAANAQKQAGEAARQGKYLEAYQMDTNAGTERAMSQRRAIEEREKATLVNSRVRALAAASGAGASDTTVQKIESDIFGKGEYNALTALYMGEERARALEFGANIRRYEGDTGLAASNQMADATMLKGFGSIAGSAGSMGAKYG